MSGVKTRRQAAASAPSTPTPAAARGQVLVNGNGSARGHTTEQEGYPRENIFVFYPNLIG
jgi:CDP-diacylglycerol--inositol 3-phosphatidyltransferase